MDNGLFGIRDANCQRMVWLWSLIEMAALVRITISKFNEELPLNSTIKNNKEKTRWGIVGKWLWCTLLMPLCPASFCYMPDATGHNVAKCKGLRASSGYASDLNKSGICLSNVADNRCRLGSDLPATQPCKRRPNHAHLHTKTHSRHEIQHRQTVRDARSACFSGRPVSSSHCCLVTLHRAHASSLKHVNMWHTHTHTQRERRDRERCRLFHCHLIATFKRKKHQ